MFGRVIYQSAASIVIALFGIVAFCASPFSETEYEDKLACDSFFDGDGMEMNETHQWGFAAAGLA